MSIGYVKKLMERELEMRGDGMKSNGPSLNRWVRSQRWQDYVRDEFTSSEISIFKKAPKLF